MGGARGGGNEGDGARGDLEVGKAAGDRVEEGSCDSSSVTRQRSEGEVGRTLSAARS